ncbi:hypothetical protein TSAR_013402 [Trichomalopsis sarcophagae]|uniref:Uncharacterized protein n=1 Tax=Trichomalopsis sarcophagae TaxID=543379 RepID=A0A232EG01_9HYME|nr:hypothetical protein TSAR_013402 [Trichomalopsis sarcophagae]
MTDLEDETMIERNCCLYYIIQVLISNPNSTPRLRDERILKKLADFFGEDSEVGDPYLPFYAPTLRKYKKRKQLQGTTDGQRGTSTNQALTSEIRHKVRLTSLFEPGSSDRPAPTIHDEKRDHHPHWPAAPEVHENENRIFPAQPPTQFQKDISKQVRAPKKAPFIVPKQPVTNSQLAKEILQMYGSGRSSEKHRLAGKRTRLITEWSFLKTLREKCSWGENRSLRGICSYRVGDSKNVVS